MKIVKIFPNTTCSGIIIELDDKTKYVISKTLIGVLKGKQELKEVKSSNILIDRTKHDCKGIKVIGTYNDIAMFNKEDLKTMSEII